MEKSKIKNDTRKVKGFFLRSRVGMMKKVASAEDFERFKREFGSLSFSAFKDYPISELVRFDEIAIKILFEKASPESYYKYGKMIFNLYAETAIGKTYFSLTQRDVLQTALEVPKIVSTVYLGLEFEVEEITKKKIRILFKNNPWDINVWKGVWAGAIEFFGSIPDIKTRKLSEEKHEYLIEWN